MPGDGSLGGAVSTLAVSPVLRTNHSQEDAQCARLLVA
jgi:hypothetical protein